MLSNFLTVKWKSNLTPNVVPSGIYFCGKSLYSKGHELIQGEWQRRRDSNPRDPHGPTPLAGERLRPLGHVSVAPFSDELRGGQEAKFLNLPGMYNVGITSVFYRCIIGLFLW